VTLSTNIYVLDEVDVADLFRFGQELLAKYDDRTPPMSADDQKWRERDSWRGDGSLGISNEIGQGLPAILDVGFRRGAPLTTAQQAATCTDDCDPDSKECGPDGYHYHPHACWADIDFDTAYGYRDSRGWGCGDLHAVLVAEVGKWLDERGVRWEWRNEFNGDVHGGDDRYARLIDLVSGGADASAWFRTSVLPAIATLAAGGGAS
jgi:hypothetical protein